MTPTFASIDKDALAADADLIRVEIGSDKSLHYVDRTGKIVWSETTPGTDRNSTLSLDHISDAHYDAGEQRFYNSHHPFTDSLKKKPGINSLQLPSDIAVGQNLQMTMRASQQAKWQGYRANELYVINASTATMYFDTESGDLYMTMQAQDENGEWWDIEELPYAWCGNSMSISELAPGEHWKFDVPVYEGELKTKLRAKLYYQTVYVHWDDHMHLGIDEDIDQILYSNEIEGSVNPGQFWIDQNHLMRHSR